MGTSYVFIIQSSRADNSNYIPSQSYGYTALEAIRFMNWFNRDSLYRYILDEEMCKQELMKNIGAKERIIPIGSVEYVTEWVSLLGGNKIKPLNIPEELWKYCSRTIKIDHLNKSDGWYYVKDTDIIKCQDNGKKFLMTSEENYDNKKYFCTEWVGETTSEWRAFICDKQLKEIKCYSGDEWVLPDKKYIEEIVRVYNKRNYVLDVMVYGNNKTEILELHDFFACGLYGFEEYSTLIKMWITAIKELLGDKWHG